MSSTYEPSIFNTKLGDSPRIRVIEAFIESRESLLTKADVLRRVYIGKGTLTAVWKDLESEGIIKSEGTIGKSKVFTLNEDSEFTAILVFLYDKILEDVLGIEGLAEYPFSKTPTLRISSTDSALQYSEQDGTPTKKRTVRSKDPSLMMSA